MAVSRPALRLLCLCAPVLLSTGSRVARADDLAFGDTAVRSVSEAEFRTELQQLKAIVTACAAEAGDCNATLPHEDERIGVGSPGAFEVHWAWLRTTLHISQTAKPEDRARYMREAQAQLEAMDRETGPASAQPGDGFARARSAANDVLRAREFEGDGGPTWWDRKIAALRNLIARLFNSVDGIGNVAPWVGKLLEWLLFLSAAVGLLVYLLRTLARQRMRLALGTAAPMSTAWDREATSWAELAETHAAAAEWREAVHCLYWAAIVLLESRRAWRHNPTRTPREYIRLLKPGSARQQVLRGLTYIFERVWYGQSAATAEDYQRARICFRQLESAAETGAATVVASAAGAAA